MRFVFLISVFWSTVFYTSANQLNHNEEQQPIIKINPEVVVYKGGKNEMFSFSCEVMSGNPTPGVRILDLNNKPVYSANSDEIRANNVVKMPPITVYEGIVLKCEADNGIGNPVIQELRVINSSDTCQALESYLHHLPNSFIIEHCTVQREDFNKHYKRCSIVGFYNPIRFIEDGISGCRDLLTGLDIPGATFPGLGDDVKPLCPSCEALKHFANEPDAWHPECEDGMFATNQSYDGKQYRINAITGHELDNDYILQILPKPANVRYYMTTYQSKEVIQFRIGNRDIMQNVVIEITFPGSRQPYVRRFLTHGNRLPIYDLLRQCCSDIGYGLADIKFRLAISDRHAGTIGPFSDYISIVVPDMVACNITDGVQHAYNHLYIMEYPGCTLEGQVAARCPTQNATFLNGTTICTPFRLEREYCTTDESKFLSDGDRCSIVGFHNPVLRSEDYVNCTDMTTGAAVVGGSFVNLQQGVDPVCEFCESLRTHFESHPGAWQPNCTDEGLFEERQSYDGKYYKVNQFSGIIIQQISKENPKVYTNVPSRGIIPAPNIDTQLF